MGPYSAARPQYLFQPEYPPPPGIRVTNIVLIGRRCDQFWHQNNLTTLVTLRY